MRQRHDNPDIDLVAVGFSPPEALADIADHLGWDGRFLSDQARVVYRTLGFGRAGLRRVFSPGTLAVYAKATLHGEKLRTPVEDTRQLGGDGIIRDGILVRRWRPRSPDDRVDAATLLGEAVTLLADT